MLSPGGSSPRLAQISTVITPAKSYDLVDLDTVKGALDLKDNKADAFLKKAIGFVSAEIAQFCNRVFPVETVEDDFWPARDPYPYQVPGGISPLQLSRWPLVSVASVVENGDTQLVQDTDFRIDATRGQLIRLDGNLYPCLWAPWSIAVVFDAGFATIPPDVEDAAVRMVTGRYAARGRDPYKRQESIPGVREVQWWIPNTPTGNMPPDVQDILDNYRVPVVA
ncbi:hypothetical protein QMZ05_12555 [Bradyrhizobium sp. INPA03-11B]|uniref:hypothetical protein n=1 Tax=Bradyrhizobium sp. INPA03-11B TaxID=418598 RepID=UPI00338E3665